MIHKKSFSLSLLALLVVAVFSFPAFAQDEPITLRMTALAGPAGQGVQALADAWNAEHPEIQVEVELQADEVNWQATAPSTMFAAEDGPDLSWWWCSPSFQYKDMIAAGILAPLDDLYSDEEWASGYPEGTLQYMLEPDGHRYGANIDVVWTPYVYYNQDIFDELGLEPPTTWEELYTIADTVREAGYQPIVTMYDYGLVNHLIDGLMLRSWSEEQYQAMLQNWSPDASEEMRQYSWNDPESIRIFQTLKEMVDNGVFADGFAGLTDYDTAKSLFTSGNAAMYQMGSWEGAATGIEAAVDFPFGYFYYPQMDQEPYGPVGSWIPNCFIVFNRENQEAAKEVVAWFASREGIETYAQTSGLTPGRIDVSPEVIDEIASDMGAQMMEDVATMGAPALFEASVPPDVLSALKQASDLVLTGAITPEEAAQMMQDAYDEAREG